MTADEFRELIAAVTDADLLGTCLFDDATPYVFEEDRDTWEGFRAEIAVELGIAAADIRVVGSGRLGFSVKPGTNLRPFTDESDVDLIVINSELFDFIWFALLDAAYPRPPATNLVGGWLQKRREDLYTGWISPLEIRLDRRIFGAKAEPLLSFNSRWFNTLKKASRLPTRRHEDVTGRVYRTLRHAELYHLNSLGALRSSP